MTTPKQGTCRSCHAPIYFERTAPGAFTPRNLDGTSHFSTCPEADQWRGLSGVEDKQRRSATKRAAERRRREAELAAMQPPMDLDA